jgi:hypothetical protein
MSEFLVVRYHIFENLSFITWLIIEINIINNILVYIFNLKIITKTLEKYIYLIKYPKNFRTILSSFCNTLQHRRYRLHKLTLNKRNRQKKKKKKKKKR